MPYPTSDDVLSTLRTVQDPDLGRDIVTLGFVKDVVVDGGAVSFKVELTTPACPVKDQLRDECHSKVLALGFEKVDVEMTARVVERPKEGRDLLPNVAHCIAIASGKGGVGKSTVSVNLALSLAATGARVGLLDADIYGPSIPMMLGVEFERPFTRDNLILPIKKHGLSMMSIGFLLEEGQAVLLRGPMVAGTVRQLLGDVDWGELDYLLVDLPPGTGDAPMTLAQIAPLTGAVIVTTPHHIAANIAGKAAQLFTRLNSSILGVVENMAGYVCPSCDAVSQIFTGMSGDELANRLKIPYLGSIPLDPTISRSSDEGVPARIAYPQSIYSKAFDLIAGKLAAQASIEAVRRSESAEAGLR